MSSPVARHRGAPARRRGGRGHAFRGGRRARRELRRRLVQFRCRTRGRRRCGRRGQSLRRGRAPRARSCRRKAKPRRRLTARPGPGLGRRSRVPEGLRARRFFGATAGDAAVALPAAAVGPALGARRRAALGLAQSGELRAGRGATARQRGRGRHGPASLLPVGPGPARAPAAVAPRRASSNAGVEGGIRWRSSGCSCLLRDAGLWTPHRLDV